MAVILGNSAANRKSQAMAVRVAIANGGTRGGGRRPPLPGNHSRSWRREWLAAVHFVNSLVRQRISGNHFVEQRKPPTRRKPQPKGNTVRQPELTGLIGLRDSDGDRL